MTNKALIIVDYQYDFVNPKGSLYVPGAEKLRSYIETKIADVKKKGGYVIATKDWHPQNHVSFSIWPPHCIQNSQGSELVFNTDKVDQVITKGFNLDFDSYSGFFDDNKEATALDKYLKDHKIDTLELVGVATDFCVQATYTDAVNLGYKVSVDLAGCKGIKRQTITK